MLDHALAQELGRQTRFRQLVHVPECSSTQDLAASDPDGADAVFWADHQTRGRGRQQHLWNDEPAADLAVTFRVRADLPVPLALPASVPVAVAQTLEPLLERELRIKWPNDVFCDDRKLAGVLIDASGGHPGTWLIGIGININRRTFPTELQASATSLTLAAGRVFDRARVLLDLTIALDGAIAALLARKTSELELLFRRRLGLVGRLVVVSAGRDYEGRLTDVDFERLVLDQRPFALGAVQGIRAAR
ncbi:MAG: biotin--[acetyl-CoA-carboxylase] ligase [Planctomycetes bacterium]|nr:biotin--[acetyl-CoA-carboxylase] ligase [Planctomycetota bacterium]